jgi:hypothetical protein
MRTMCMRSLSVTKPSRSTSKMANKTAHTTIHAPQHPLENVGESRHRSSRQDVPTAILMKAEAATNPQGQDMRRIERIGGVCGWESGRGKATRHVTVHTVTNISS